MRTTAPSLRRTDVEAPEPGTPRSQATASEVRRPPRPWSRLAGWVLLAVLGLPPAAVADEIPAPPPEQVAQYRAEGRKTIIELQQFRRSQSIVAEDASGRRGNATLIELNPYVNAWFLLTLDWSDPAGRPSFHLENPDPDGQHLSLVGTQPHGLLITGHDATVTCDLWSGDPSALGNARATALPYAPLCDGRLYLRNPVAGHRTDLERVADLLRDHVWGGEALVGFVRQKFFRDAFIESGTAGPSAGPMGSYPAPRSRHR